MGRFIRFQERTGGPLLFQSVDQSPDERTGYRRGFTGYPISGNRTVEFGGSAWNSTKPWQPSRRQGAVRSQRLKSGLFSRSILPRFACILSPQVVHTVITSQRSARIHPMVGQASRQSEIE